MLLFVTPFLLFSLNPECNIQSVGKKSNAIVLVNDLVSRYHSAIIIDAEGLASVEDRGSRNGTLVNGVKIRERTALKLDDKVTIGSYNIFYKNLSTSQAEDMPAGLADGTTLALGALGGPDGMVGSLSHMSMTELFTTLEYNGKTGILSISHSDAEGKVFFKDGNIIRCEYKGLLNLEAIYRLLKLQEGVFEFVAKDLSSRPSEIPLTTQQILLEYARGLDKRSQ